MISSKYKKNIDSCFIGEIYRKSQRTYRGHVEKKELKKNKQIKHNSFDNAFYEYEYMKKYIIVGLLDISFCNKSFLDNFKF